MLLLLSRKDVKVITTKIKLTLSTEDLLV